MRYNVVMFDYGVWEPGSSVKLCRVRWDAGYVNVVDWRDLDRDTYFASIPGRTITVNKVTYCAPNRPVRLNIPYARAFEYNYLAVRNASPVEGDTVLYYFINDLTYVAPNTTELQLQLDVWTTYQHLMQFRRAYVTRGHAAMWLHDRYGTIDGREWLCRPEGLDTGSTPLIGAVASWELCNTSNYYVVITSTISLATEYGSEDNPKFRAASGSRAEQLPNGCEIYLATKEQFGALANYLKDYPWVAQGISSITLVPDEMVDTGNLHIIKTNGGAGPDLYGFVFAGRMQRTMWSNFRARIMMALPERYRGLLKFATSPFSYIEVTTYSGTPIHVAPEMISDTKLALTVMGHAVPPSPRLMVSVDCLGQHGTPGDSYGGYSEWLDNMTGITAMPQFALANNNALLSQASQAHSIQYQRESAAWQQHKAIAGAQLGYDQASAAMSASGQQTNLSNAIAAQQTALANSTRNQMWELNTAFGVGGGVVRGAIGGAAGGPAGVAAGALGGGVAAGVNAWQSRLSTDITNSAASASQGISAAGAIQSNQISQALGAYNRDGNYALAASNAHGDYEMAISSINAKLQDMQLTPPGMVGQSGGDAFNLVHNGMRVDCRIKIPHMGYVRSIGEYWFRYGYSLNEYIHLPQNLSCMSKFTYWKCVDVTLTGDCPSSMTDVVSAALVRGITVWRDPSDIGTIDYADNSTVDAEMSV